MNEALRRHIHGKLQPMDEPSLFERWRQVFRDADEAGAPVESPFVGMLLVAAGFGIAAAFAFFTP